MKIKWENFALVLVVCAVIQGSILVFFEVERCTPDVFLLLVIFLCLDVNRQQAMLAAWITGLWRDISSAGRLGFYAFLFMAAAFFIIKMRDEIYIERYLTRMLLVFFVSMAVNCAAVVYVTLVFNYRLTTGFFLSVLLLSLYNVVVTPVLLPIFSRLSIYRKFEA